MQPRSVQNARKVVASSQAVQAHKRLSRSFATSPFRSSPVLSYEASAGPGAVHATGGES